MAVVKSVEVITASFTAAAAQETITVDLSKGQDEANCVPFCSAKSGSSEPSDFFPNRMYDVHFDNSGGPRVNFVRDATSAEGTIDITCYVVEFDDTLVNVQQGTFSITSGPATASITSVTQAKAFALFYNVGDGTNSDDHNDGLIRVHFNSDTELGFDRATNGVPDWDGHWYVVECIGTDFSTQFLQIALAQTAESNTASPSAVTLANSFLVGSYETSENSDDAKDGNVNWHLTGTTTITLYRDHVGSPSATVDADIWLVECDDTEWDVQRFATDVDGSLSNTQAITSIDQDVTAIIVNHQQNHVLPITDTISGPLITGYLTMLDFSADDEVTLVRNSQTSISGSNTNVRFEVVEFDVAAGGDVSILPPAAQLAWSTTAPTVLTPVGIEIPAAQLQFSTAAPSLMFGFTIEPPAANLQWSTTAPTVDVTNNVSIEIPAAQLQWSSTAPTVAVVTFAPDVDKFRFYNDGTESGATPKAAEDTDIFLASVGDAEFHLRVRVQETGGGDGAGTDNWNVQYSKNSGAWTTIQNDTSNVTFDPTSGLVDGGATTQRLTAGTGSFVAGVQEEDTGPILNKQLTASDHLEHVFGLKLVDADLANGDTLDFRITLNLGVSDITNTATPRITVSKPIIPPAANLQFSTTAPALVFSISPPAANLQWTTTAPIVAVTDNISIEIPAAQLEFSATAPDVLQDYGRIPPAAQLEWSSTAPSVSVDAPGATNIEIPAAQLVWSTSAPTLSLGIVRIPPAANLEWSSTAPTLSQGLVREPPAAQLEVSTTAPALLQNFIRVPDAAQLEWSTTAPTILIPADVSIEIPAANLQFSTAAPVLDVSGQVVQTFGNLGEVPQDLRKKRKKFVNKRNKLREQIAALVEDRPLPSPSAAPRRPMPASPVSPSVSSETERLSAALAAAEGELREVDKEIQALILKREEEELMAILLLTA